VLAIVAKPQPVLVQPVAEAEDPLLTDLLQQWEDEHAQSSKDSRRRWRQVAGHLEAFHPGLRISQLTKAFYQQYLAYLHQQGLSDATVGKQVSFLRTCLRLAERHIPTWLQVKVRKGRPVALRREEFLALTAFRPAHPYLQREQERMLFQTMLLLRDSDFRQLRAYHVTEQELAGVGRVLVLEFHQKKTGDEVRLPLPPLAAAIWRGWRYEPPLITLQKRNEYIKELAEAAGLDRTFVRVRFRANRPEEVPMPLHRAVSTHTPRHTGADLVLWGSSGDQNLKEAALGHTSGASIYGYDTLERYGPLFLKAWEQVGAPDFLHPENASDAV
jgi:integrase